jgi:23S rRNA pseudouridine2605 synthase
MPLKKIQLIIRDAGVGSRRAADQIIREGRVTLNGAVVTDPAVTADPEKDHIKVDGKLLKPVEPARAYYLFNKPRNVVSTMKDPEGRPCIGDLLKTLGKTLFTVGRLDFDAEGLMILTNDGQFAQKLGHPSHRVQRTYLVKVRGNPDDKTLGRIRKGLDIGDGERLGDVQFSVINRQKTTTWIKLALFEGRKNEIKRIFFRIDHPVRKIRRIGFGPFSLGSLPSGQWRPFTKDEQSSLTGMLK